MSEPPTLTMKSEPQTQTPLKMAQRWLERAQSPVRHAIHPSERMKQPLAAYCVQRTKINIHFGTLLVVAS
jgi:hypothetical protein